MNYNFKVDFTCSKCNEKSKIDKKYILPGYDSDGYDDYLIFYAKCPKCLYTSTIKNSIIPNNIKLELMKKYSLIASETLRIWNLEYEINLLNKKKNELENIKNCIVKKRKNDNYLFNGWYDSQSLVKNEEEVTKKLMI